MDEALLPNIDAMTQRDHLTEISLGEGATLLP
jgi:hypothetical protein